MAIQEQDIQILESQVLADVPEGGGAATGNEVVDGLSNNLFPDISELDRVYGAVNLRKVFVAVRTPDTEGYFGAHVIVSKPPEDPDVSAVLFDLEDDFDRRTDAASRIEAYLAPGTIYAGYLFGNHLAGQMSVSLLQRIERPLPVVGGTLVLLKNEGLSSEYQQFIRITDVVGTERTFTDVDGDFTRMEVVMGISDALGQDFPGFNAIRRDAEINYTGKTKTLETVVADASRYYGISPLVEDADTGDFLVKAESIYEQLVPSSRTEVPIADARMNQQSATLVKAGEPFSRTLTLAFTTTQALYVGGRILPNSVTVVRGATTLTDQGGALVDSSGASVGTIDYENGILTLATNVFGTSPGDHVVTYTPASAPTLVGATLEIPVTQEGQRLTYTTSIEPPPARGTLQVSFRAQGSWYTLQDDGSGALRGADSSSGAGTLNQATGTVAMTLGALPDVDSRIILAYVPAVVSRPIETVPPAGPMLDRAFGKPVNLGIALKPGTISITWNDGSARTATDNDGVLTGDASGTVNYSEGIIDFRPDILPPLNTAVTIAVTEADQVKTDLITFVDGGANWTGTLPGPLKENSVELAIVVQYTGPAANAYAQYRGEPTTISLRLVDDGAGLLFTPNIDGNLSVGTINYTTGAISIPKTVTGYKIDVPKYVLVQPFGLPYSMVQNGYEIITVPLTVLNGPGATTPEAPPWAWWSGTQSNALEARYAGSDGSGTSYPFTMDSVFMAASNGGFGSTPGQSVNIESFMLGTAFHSFNAVDSTWQRNPSPTTGIGTEVGVKAVVGGVTGVLLSSWPVGVSSAPTGVAGATVPAISGQSSLLTFDTVTFRTAISPLLNGGFNVAGTWTHNGLGFSVTADEDGVIASGSAVVGATPGSVGVFGLVDYEMGIATLYFGRRVPASMASDDYVIDLTGFGVPGLTYLQSYPVQADTLRYNAVGYSYLPLDAEVLGLNSVRLPPDGRVPIFRAGTVAVVHHTASMSPATVSNGQTLNTSRVRLARLRVIGADGVTIESGYTVNLDAGTVTFTNVTGYSQPVTVEHSIEDAALVSAAQINGSLRLSRALTHDYPAGSYVSSALIIGNMFARVPLLFDQATWNTSSPVWSDDVQGAAAGASFDTINYPVVVTNLSAVTERWALVFTGTTAFSIYGEHFGLIGTGNTSADCRPLNPETGEPYFHLDFEGFGSGWPVGSAIRFNTVGAMAPIWWARVIKQGVATEASDSAAILARGDINTP